MPILFLHGAHGYADDQAIAAALRIGLDDEVRMPDMGDQDMSHATWSARIADHVAPDVDTVVGHSFGGSTILKLLTESRLDIDRLVLLSAPDWGPEGWDVAEYALPDDADQRLDPGLSIELHHCLDDEVVPADHAGLLARRLPRSTVVRHSHGGHSSRGPRSTPSSRRSASRRHASQGPARTGECAGALARVCRCSWNRSLRPKRPWRSSRTPRRATWSRLCRIR